ncbi:transposase [Chitinibacter fontanus]|uniref:Transposase n=1 Tax=Chitinibacter fontanus TaxID=1737446 RepID=A0A7D5VAB5_9NEIS|nr:transposase [Chitinibacter fontanus]
MNQILAFEEIAVIKGDGAYDTKECHNAIAVHGAATIIPMRKNAQFRKENIAGARAQNAILRATQYLGRSIREKCSGYHRRSLVETKMRCFKIRLGFGVIRLQADLSNKASTYLLLFLPA